MSSIRLSSNIHFYNMVPTLHKTRQTISSFTSTSTSGWSSHTRNIELVDLARENHVSIVSIPPHSSHKIQPLDKTFMGPLKSYLSEEIRVWMRSNGRALTHFDMAELYGKAYLRIESEEIAINGFRTTGIFPLNRYIFRDHEFLPADDVASHSPPQEFESAYEVPHEILNNETIVESPHPISDICNENVNRSVLSELETNSRIKRKMFRKKEENKFLIPSDLDDNYSVRDESDGEILEFVNAGEKEDAKCLYCSTFYSEYRSGEIWVQCVSCKNWSHEECAGCEQDLFICDMCTQ